MEMEAPLPDFLSGIPTNVLLLINNHITCLVQRRRLAQACRAFRDAVNKQQQQQRAPPVLLPWIHPPRADGTSFSCVLRGCDTHEPHDHGLDDIPVDARAARYSGSGWVFPTLGQTDGHKLLSLRTDVGGGLDLAMQTTIVAATLSSPREHGHCVVAAICFCVPMPAGDDGEHNIAEYTWNELQGRGCCSRSYEVANYPGFNDGIYFLDDGRFCDGQPHDRYLVESRDELLMVVKLSPREIPRMTSAFRVFRMVQVQKKPKDDDDKPEYTWNELQGMLFIGRCCSRSYTLRSHGTTAPPSAPNQRQTWNEVPGELLELIVRHLPWLADRIKASAVCVSWLAAFAAKPPLPPQLPFLVLPRRRELLQSRNDARTPIIYCVVDKEVYQMSKLPQARIFGSYDGGWLFVAHGQTDRHKFFNFYSNRSISVPNSVLTWDEKTIPLTMLVATLCCAPPPVIGPIAPPELRCIGAAIVSALPDVTIQSPRNRFLLWFIGEEEPFNFSAPPNSWRVVDVIYHSGAFRFLTESEDMIDVKIHFDEERELSSIGEESVFFEERGRDDQDDRPHHVDGRYLVESREKLLMVVRLSCLTRTTPEFEVFQMDKLPASPDPMEPARGEWTALPALEGRILFVAPGCSRSYEVADFPYSKEGIYFLDDREYHHDRMMHSEAEYRKYSCNENGCWTQQESHVDLWFPEEPTSSFSPPVWFLS